jgi:hypothetical protein
MAFGLVSGVSAQEQLQRSPLRTQELQQRQPLPGAAPRRIAPAITNKAPISNFKFLGAVKSVDPRVLQSLGSDSDAGFIPPDSFEEPTAFFEVADPKKLGLGRIHGIGPNGESISTNMVFPVPMNCGNIERQALLYTTDATITRGKPKGTDSATHAELYKGWNAAGCGNDPKRQFPPDPKAPKLIN